MRCWVGPIHWPPWSSGVPSAAGRVRVRPPTRAGASGPAASGGGRARHGRRGPAPAGTDPAEIARAVCGIHAQVLSAAEVSLALRIEGATGADVRRALWEDRGLVQTYGPRGTVHLLPTRDLPMWTGASAPRWPTPS